MPKKMNTQDFINKAISKHGIKWDYTETEYFGNSKPVAIRCREHGVFTPLANDHLSKLAGCPDCAGVRRLTTFQFIEKANKIHGSFNYGKVIYKNTETKVNIVCKKGHSFWQTPHDHLQGAGCSFCAGLAPITYENFLNKASEIHGESYDYSLVKYKSFTKDKIEIICNFHKKSFWQTPQSHCEGHGCPICGGIKFITDEEFIVKAVTKHGSKYNYKKSHYEGKMKPVCIICPIHGEFWQRPLHHLSGAGCPDCAENKFDLSIPSTLYVINIDDKFVGFGITNNFKDRLSAHKTSFKNHKVSHEVIATFVAIGKEVLRVEDMIKTNFEILNTGIDGFKTEAIVIENLPKLLDFINENLGISTTI